MTGPLTVVCIAQFVLARVVHGQNMCLNTRSNKWSTSGLHRPIGGCVRGVCVRVREKEWVGGWVCFVRACVVGERVRGRVFLLCACMCCERVGE